MVDRSSKAIFAVGALSIALAVGCGTQEAVRVGASEPADAGPFSLSGYVLKGPVSGAAVTAYTLHADLSTGDALGSTTSGESGL